MDRDLEKIEIRSEKIRNIMSEEPPFVIRYGTVIISIILLISAVCIYIFMASSN